MKSTKSNSLQHALAVGDPGPHPDANMLSAFAEDALLPRERESVLAHMARCAECREVLGLAGNAVGLHAVSSPGVAARWTGWRIGAPLLAAAALIAVVSTLVVRHTMISPPQRMTVAKNAEVQANQPAPQAPAPPADTGVPAPAEQRREVRKPTPEKTAPAEVAPPATVEPSIVASPLPAPFHSEESATRDSGTEQLSSAKRASPAPPRPALQAPAPASAFANTVTSHALAAAPAATIARPHWRINVQGQPERAFGDGQWQPVLPNGSAKMHALAVFEGEVWVGGEKSQVLRSLDNGTSWRIVALPEKSGTDHTIAHIRFTSPQEIAIEASDGTQWTTVDGGATWK